MSATWHEKWCKFWVFGPVHFRGHFEEIGIAKDKPRRVEKFRDVGFPTSEKVWREKNNNKLSAKYNGSLALATLERATIIITELYYKKEVSARVACEAELRQ